MWNCCTIQARGDYLCPCAFGSDTTKFQLTCTKVTIHDFTEQTKYIHTDPWLIEWIRNALRSLNFFCDVWFYRRLHNTALINIVIMVSFCYYFLLFNDLFLDTVDQIIDTKFCVTFLSRISLRWCIPVSYMYFESHNLRLYFSRC